MIYGIIFYGKELICQEATDLLVIIDTHHYGLGLSSYGDSKLKKLQEEDHLAIFKPSLWRTGFFGCGEE